MDDILDEFDMDETAVPAPSEGTRTRFTCDLCGYEPNSKNKFRAKQVNSLLSWQSSRFLLSNYVTYTEKPAVQGSRSFMNDVTALGDLRGQTFSDDSILNLCTEKHDDKG